MSAVDRIKDKKKILFIEINTDGTIGGSHYCLLELVRDIDRKKYDPVVVFFEHNVLEAEFKKLCQVHVFEWNRLNLQQLLPKILRRIPPIYYLIISFQKIGNLCLHTTPDFIRNLIFLRKSNIDLVHINNAPYLIDWLLACRLLGIKCTSHLRGNLIRPRPILDRFIKYYDIIIAISGSVKGFIIKQGVKAEKVVIVYDGIDINIPQNVLPMTRSELAMTFQLPKQTDCVIGCVGNIKPWKGQHVLIDAMNILKKKHPLLKCLIIGDVGRMAEDVEYFKRLKEMIHQYNLEENIIYTGFRKDVLRIVCNLDILVHTSVEPEPLGRVILEGMLLSRPVIATAHGGPLDIIEDGVSGYLVQPDDATALAETLGLLLTDAALRERIGRQAKQRIEQHFSLKESVQETEHIFEQVISKG